VCLMRRRWRVSARRDTAGATTASPRNRRSSDTPRSALLESRRGPRDHAAGVPDRHLAGPPGRPPGRPDRVRGVGAGRGPPRRGGADPPPGGQAHRLPGGGAPAGGPGAGRGVGRGAPRGEHPEWLAAARRPSLPTLRPPARGSAASAT
jgi:hypothetical protein